MRNIFIFGCGNFGYHLARKIGHKAHVTVVDTDRSKIQSIGNEVERAIVGDTTSKEFLLEIDADAADAVVVSMGESMEASILTTMHVHSLGVSEIYVKAFSDDHVRILQLLGASRVIQPEREVAENLAVSILETSVYDFLRLHEHFGIVEESAHPEFWGKSLMEIGLRRRYRVTVIGLFRDSDRLINPNAETVIQEGDRLMMLGSEEDLAAYREKYHGE